MRRRVVVSGIGLVSAAGCGIDAVWSRLRSDPPAPSPYNGPGPTESIRFPLYRAVPYELGDLGVPDRCLHWLRDERLAGTRDLEHLLGSTALALRDAGLPMDCSLEDGRAAVVVANESPGFEQLSQALFSFGADGAPPDDPRERYAGLAERFFQLNTFLLPHYLARAFRMEGLTLFVNSACTSGLNALDIAAGEIRAGRSRIAIAAAADDPASVAKFLWFDQQGLYARDGALRPFDARQTGTVFGDGGAALVLEELESATARGARVYAEYLGAGFAQDGWKISAPSPVKASAVQALERAFAEAGVDRADIDLAVPHGVGTPASDQYESLVLHRVFGALDRWPAVTAFKPFLGHNLGGSALLEMTLLLAAIERQTVPPTLGHETPFPRNPLPLVRAWEPRRIEIAAKLTCGFAGFYGAAVFRRPDSEGGSRA
jgi:3-oxoacyl-[acyl-carrier-protein] synthase II